MVNNEDYNGGKLSGRLANPLEQAGLKPEGSYKVAGVFAILATLCFVALLVLQWLEWRYIANF